MHKTAGTVLLSDIIIKARGHGITITVKVLHRLYIHRLQTDILPLSTLLCSICRKHFPFLSSFMTYHRGCNKINTTCATTGAGTAYPSGAPEFTTDFSGVRVTRSLVLCVCFVDRCLSFCAFSVGHCVACSSLIYGFWLPLWYLQTLLLKILHKEKNNIFIHQCLAIFALLHFWRIFTFDQLSSMNLKLVRSRTAIYAIKLDQKQKFKFKIYYRTM